VGVGLTAAMGLCVALLPSWPSAFYDSGIMFRSGLLSPHRNSKGHRRGSDKAPNRLLFLREGVHATITVREFEDAVTLYTNGKPDASSHHDMSTQALLGVIPLLVHPRPRDVAVVGWGSGVTVYAASLVPGIRRLDVMEIEPAIVEGSKYFHGVNGAVERDPRVSITYDDARSHLLTIKRQYDVILSEPSNPWMAGVAALYTADFYAAVRKRLRPGGILGQWLQTYGVDRRTLRLVFRTLLASFPHVQLWVLDDGNLLLLGSDRVTLPALEPIRRAYEKSPRLARLVGRYGPGRRPANLLGCYMLGRAAIARLGGHGDPEVLTDDRPVLEYWALRGLQGTWRGHLKWLWEARMANNAVMPPTRKALPEGGAEALVGATALIKDRPRLRVRVIDWALAKLPDSPGLLLARAKALVAAGRLDQALRMADATPASAGELARGMRLVRARALFHEGKAAEALVVLDSLPGYRPAVVQWYRFEAAQRLRRYAMAWGALEDLARRIKAGRDLDALRIGRSLLFGAVRDLAHASGDHRRAVRLYRAAGPGTPGAFQRLVGLAESNLALGQGPRASAALDALLQFRPAPRWVRQLCPKIRALNHATGPCP